MMMKEIKEESQHFDDYLDIIIDESDRLTAMIEDMLLMSKIQAGDDIISMESFNLEDLLISVIHKLNLFAKSRHVELKYVAMSPDKWTNGDPQKIIPSFFIILCITVSNTLMKVQVCSYQLKKMRRT